MSKPTPRTPYSAIITALKNVTVLSADDAERIAREPVMVEVMHIRDAADQMQRDLTAALAKIADRDAEVGRLRREVVNRNRRALDGDKAVAAFDASEERAAQAEAREQALRVALDKCREFAEREKRKATFPKLDDPDYDDPWIWDCDAIIAVIDAARKVTP